MPIVRSVLVLLVTLCVVAGSADAQPARSSSRSTWTISFELAFGGASPYAARFPSLYDLWYASNAAITRDVLERVAAHACSLARIEKVALRYGPGAYLTYPVQPSAHLAVRGDRDRAEAAAAIVGYLAQQTEVLASRVDRASSHRVVEIVERAGVRLRQAWTAASYWRALHAGAPMLQGFAPLVIGSTRPGLRIIDLERAWSPVDTAQIAKAASRAADLHETAVDVRWSSVELVRVRNDWTTEASGEGYLSIIRRTLSSATERAVIALAPRVEAWITAAFRRHAPRAWRRHREKEMGCMDDELLPLPLKARAIAPHLATRRRLPYRSPCFAGANR